MAGAVLFPRVASAVERCRAPLTNSVAQTAAPAITTTTIDMIRRFISNAPQVPRMTSSLRPQRIGPITYSLSHGGNALTSCGGFRGHVEGSEGRARTPFGKPPGHPGR